jgi:hypothetical protein
MWWSAVKTVWRAYSGLVPMSPNTTPSAPRVSAAMPAVARAGRFGSSRAEGPAVEAGSPSGSSGAGVCCVSVDMRRLHTVWISNSRRRPSGP